MELDKDLIRDLLLTLESKEHDSSMNEKEINLFAENKSISKEKIIYTIQKLKEAGFIKANITYASDKVYWYHISTITYTGHEFLDNIRDPKVWEFTKEKATQLGSVSLTILSQIASSYIKNLLGL